MKNLAALLFTGLSTLGFLSLSHAQTLNTVRDGMRADLEKATQQLSELRNSIAEQKIPLAQEVSALEEQVIQQRREVDALRRVRDAASIDLDQIKRIAGQLREQQNYVNNLLNEFARTFQDRLHVSERPLYFQGAQDAITAPNNPDLTLEQRLAAQLNAVDTALDRIEGLMGGVSYQGTANAGGARREGKFLRFGPTVFFASSDGAFAGIAERELNSTEPTVLELGRDFTAMIAQTVNANQGDLPLDATLGKALQIRLNTKGIGDYVEDGGWVGNAIIALGFVALFVALFKVYEVVSFPAPTIPQVSTVLERLDAGDSDGAATAAARVPGIGGEMLAVGVTHFREKRGVIEELLFAKVLMARPHLERFLPFLAITAAVAPLMGLLGTVVGMIKTFNLITIFGTGDAKSLSGGISEALVTTALGLIVAIPVLVLHGILLRMAKKKVGMMEQAAVNFVNGVAVSPRHRDNKVA